jgi:MFS family permease
LVLFFKKEQLPCFFIPTAPLKPLYMTSRPSRIILAASAGNALEFYDFTLFGYFVPQLSDAFFPAHTHTGSLLYAWGTYGTAFLARPLGAMVLGSYADRAGRRAAMSLAIVLMTLGTAMVAIMPRYSSIGVLAPLGILLARVVQGFSTGGEFGGATAFMLEHGRGRRGFMASFQFTSQVVSNLAGGGVAWTTSMLMSAQALHDWGFRIPFFIGLLIGPVGLWLRRHADESPVFENTAHQGRPALTVFAHYWVRVLLAACRNSRHVSGYLSADLRANRAAHVGQQQFSAADARQRHFAGGDAGFRQLFGPDRAYGALPDRRSSDGRAGVSKLRRHRLAAGVRDGGVGRGGYCRAAQFLFRAAAGAIR